ncbi:MAG: Crp/Fnr family transcriptional regulator [Deltaproteobacteria bacterium]|nr:Crp/Fnr family transcriptional regulator [Deltaproteobacteria bacterium]MCF8120728.1 Crp/Fnr family transcriptional regulator [Deltaproteobacteria bacterium]
MVSIEELRKIRVLDNLTQPMLENMRPLTELSLFGERHVVYKKGEPAKYFYMLIKGKVILEVEAAEGLMISLGAVKPGYSFGWSSLLSGSEYSTYAICVEPCEMMAIPGDKFLELLERNHSIGYKFMNSVARILKRRLERRTGQFIQVISKHPDLQKLMGV